MKKNDWVAYVGPFQFPWGQPGSRRVFGIAAALASVGHHVEVGAGQWGEAGANLIPGYHNIEYFTLGDLPRNEAGVLEKVVQLFYLSGKKTINWLNTRQKLPGCVIVYGAGAPFMHRLMKWGKKNRVPIIADVVEWYDPSHMTGGYFGPFHISAKAAMHYYFPRCSGVIGISSLLSRHYASNGNARVVRIPPITDVSGDKLPEGRFLIKNERIKLIYAGAPGKKDLLAIVINGLASVDPNGNVFKLEVLGPTAENVAALLGREIPPFVEVLGRIPQDQVSERLRHADFSVLIRESKLFANAGFSTKFVESLANGTPVIANITSDLGLYLHDGVEGVVCADHSVASFIEALRKISVMSFDEMVKMRRNARSQALASFDYRDYGLVLSDFLDSLKI